MSYKSGTKLYPTKHNAYAPLWHVSHRSNGAYGGTTLLKRYIVKKTHTSDTWGAKMTLLAMSAIIASLMIKEYQKYLTAPLISPIELNELVKPVQASEPRLPASPSPVAQAGRETRGETGSIEIIEEVFSGYKDIETIKHVAFCESSYNEKAKNKHSSASGLYQIINSTWSHYGCTGDKFDARDNATCAKKIYDKSGLKPWRASQHCWGVK